MSVGCESISLSRCPPGESMARHHRRWKQNFSALLRCPNHFYLLLWTKLKTWNLLRAQKLLTIRRARASGRCLAKELSVLSLLARAPRGLKLTVLGAICVWQRSSSQDPILVLIPEPFRKDTWQHRAQGWLFWHCIQSNHFSESNALFLARPRRHHYFVSEQQAKSEIESFLAQHYPVEPVVERFPSSFALINLKEIA